ncbi:MAG TPA: hypothetical protein VFC19_40190 [Candidatus Limnocylindrales bacterium]|nr:hypothetical protein [Candidatus Limnocylindrales bacterium]
MRGPKLLLPLMVLALASACTSTPTPQAEPPTVPSAPSPAPPTSAPPETNYDKALRFTRCMNETLEAMYPGRGRKAPDPVEGKPLQTWVTVPSGVYQGRAAGAVMEDENSGWQIMVPEPFEKCKHLLPPVWPVKEDPDDTRRFGVFYECLRKRGIDVPRPDSNGIIMSNPNPEATQTDEYRAAENACRHLADDPAVKAGDR